MSQYEYEMTAAWLQLGEAPFTMWTLQVRMNGDMPQVGIRQERGEDVMWYDWPKDGPRHLPVKRYRGMKVAGIASDWRLR